MNFPCCDLIYWDWAIFYRTCWPPFPDCQKCVNAILFWNCFDFSVLLNCCTRQNLKEIKLFVWPKHTLRNQNICIFFVCLQVGGSIANIFSISCSFVAFIAASLLSRNIRTHPKIIQTELFMFFLQNLWASQKTPQKDCQFKRSSFQR